MPTGLQRKKIFKFTAEWDLLGPRTVIFTIDAHDSWAWRSARRAFGANVSCNTSRLRLRKGALMDFNDTPAEASFRNEVRAWLEKNAKRRAKSSADTRERRRANDYVQRSKEWQRKKAEAGFTCITWPKEFGGRGGTAMQQVIYDQEEAAFDVPPSVSLIGLGMCIPTVLAVGDAATKKRFVSSAIRGEHIWCQLISEPAGG